MQELIINMPMIMLSDVGAGALPIGQHSQGETGGSYQLRLVHSINHNPFCKGTVPVCMACAPHVSGW